jgi:hypothetical protein
VAFEGKRLKRIYVFNNENPWPCGWKKKKVTEKPRKDCQNGHERWYQILKNCVGPKNLAHPKNKIVPSKLGIRWGPKKYKEN